MASKADASQQAAARLRNKESLDVLEDLQKWKPGFSWPEEFAHCSLEDLHAFSGEDLTKSLPPLMASMLYNLLHPQAQQAKGRDGGGETPAKRSRTEPASEPSIDSFWKACCQVEDATIVGDSVINLLCDGNPVNILGNPALGTSIFVRKCYMDLADMLVKNWKASEHHVVLQGTPGIGKSFFGYFALIVCAKEKKTVLYQSRDGARFFFRRTDLGYDVLLGWVHNGDFSSKLKTDTSIFYIMDACEPRDQVISAGQAILITSPFQKRYEQFYREQCTMMYVPLWSYEELEMLRTALYNDKVPLAMFKELSYRWGPLPRYVLYYAHNQAQQDELSKALQRAEDNLESIFSSMDSQVESDRIGHRVVHFATEAYETVQYQWASDYVKVELVRRLQARNRRKLTDFVRAADAHPLFGSLRGPLFEFLVHDILRAGYAEQTPFVSRKLRSSGTASPDLPAEEAVQFPTNSTSVIFYDEEELRNALLDPRAETTYFRPLKKNFESVDSFRVVRGCPILFQVAVGETHPLKHKGMLEVLNLFGNPQGGVKLYFVVPRDRYKSYVNVQPYHNDKKVDGKWVIRTDALDPIVAGVEQYVLVVDV